MNKNYHNKRDSSGRFAPISNSKLKAEPTDKWMRFVENLLKDIGEVKERILFFDIETSPNIVFSWNIGNKISLTPDNIIEERAIICISYKWSDEDTVTTLQWDKGDDTEMLRKFVKVMNQADSLCTHNGNAFDIKWIRTRCLLHGIDMLSKYKSIDTLKLARKAFKLNSNKLDYIGKFLGVGKKQETGYGLWRDIVLNNDKVAMDKMKEYCANDVILLEKIYNQIEKYTRK